MPRADMRVEGARHPRGAGNGGIPEDISSGRDAARARSTVYNRARDPPQDAIAAVTNKQLT